MEGGERRMRKGVQKELWGVQYVHRLPKLNTNIMDSKHLLMNRNIIKKYMQEKCTSRALEDTNDCGHTANLPGILESTVRVFSSSTLFPRVVLNSILPLIKFCSRHKKLWQLRVLRVYVSIWLNSRQALSSTVDPVSLSLACNVGLSKSLQWLYDKLSFREH